MTTTVPAQSFEVGSRINDRFEVLGVLGSGGFGCVYKVKDLADADGPRVALKTIKLEKSEGLSVELFQREFAELTKLSHPNIATAYEYGRISSNAQHFFTAEYIDGVDLTVGTRGKALESKLAVFAEVCRALEFVHNRGLIHHDLKPGNILLAVPSAVDEDLDGIEGLGKLEMRLADRARVVKLIDFGLIDFEDLASECVLGTPPYMSPERIQLRETDRRSDLYSLGVILFRLLTDAYPFDARGREWYQAHLKWKPKRPEDRGVQCPAALGDLVLRLLEKDPANRFASAAEVVQALNTATGHEFSIDTRESSSQYLVSGPIVGRDDEIATLRTSFDKVASGDSEGTRSITVAGLPGHGITRLLDDLRYHSQRSGAVVLRVDVKAGPSLTGFIDQIRREMRIIGQELDLEELSDDVPIAAIRLRVEESLRALACNSPVVLLVDHVQLADEVVVDLCRELIASLRLDEGATGPGIMLVLGDSGGEPADTIQAEGLGRVTLHAFDEPMIGRLLEESFGLLEVPENFVRKLWQVSEGNPLYVVETLRHLASEGEIRRVGGKWALPKRPELLELPDSLSTLAASKLLELSERVKSVLEWIAAYGSPVSIESLERVTDTTSSSLVGLVWGQVKSTLLTRVRHVTTDGAVEARYRFSHETLRTVLLDSISAERRAELHASIAVALESESGKPPVEELASHWLAAGDVDRFLEVGFEAAESLHSRGEIVRAKEVYSECLQGLPVTDLRRRFQAMGKLSELDEAAGHLGDAAESAEQLLGAAERFLKPRDKGRLCRRIALLRAKAGDDVAARTWLGKAQVGESDLDRLSLLSVQLFIDETIGDADSNEGVWPQCRILLDSIADPDDVPSKRLLSGTLDLIGKCAHRRGDHGLGIGAFERSRRLCEVVGSQQGVAASTANVGWLHHEIGEYKKAAVLFESAIAIARTVGDRPTLARALVGQAETLICRGDGESALELATEALRTAKIGADSASISRAFQVLGSIQVLVGHGLAARENMERALSYENEGTFNASVAAARLGRVLVALEELDAATTVLSRAREWGERLHSPRVLCLTALAEARLHLKAGREEVANSKIAECAKIAQHHGFSREYAEILLVRATQELCEGDKERAKKTVQSASETADRIETSDLASTARALFAKIEAS